MTNIEKYNEAFLSALDITAADLGAGCTVSDMAQWDSIAHITLVGNLEDTFDIMLDADDIIQFNSYESGKEILAKYDVVF